MVDPPGRAAEDEQVAALQPDVGERGRAATDAGQSEQRRVAEADRHDGCVGGLLGVAVQAEPGPGAYRLAITASGANPPSSP